jgi:hypothetical protein
LLGGVESTVPADVKWAREVIDGLAAGGEADVRVAKDIESGLSELANMFPSGGTEILSATDSATIREALASENVQEHLPALRGAVRSTLDRVKARYQERRLAYAGSLQAILREFEAAPDWTRLEPDDREELAQKVAPQGLSEMPAIGREVADLRLLLAREANVNALRAEVAGEIRRRLPAPPLPSGPKEPPTEEVVDLADLSIPEVIKTTDDVDAWLSSLRVRLTELLRSNKIVRIRKRSQ